MNHEDKQCLKDPSMAPTEELLAQVLGPSYAAYQALQDALPSLEMEQLWQWYTPYKVWFAKGQHRWTTPRGTRKEKNLYWLHVYEGYFAVAIWFKEKERGAVFQAEVCDKTRQGILDAETLGKMPTFSLVLEITGAEALGDVYALLECKKRLEK